MWRSILIVTGIVCLWGLAEGGRDYLKEQLTMLRQEQWRDKERIEALERKVGGREERGSSPNVLGDVLEEVRKEVQGLTEELRGMMQVEAEVQALQETVNQGIGILREIGEDLGNLKNEQKRMWKEITALRNRITQAEVSTEVPVIEVTQNPFLSEGSGDFEVDSLIPVDGGHKSIDREKKLSQVEHNVRAMMESQKSQLQDLEQSFNEEKSTLRTLIQETQNQAKQTKQHCQELVANATDKIQLTASVVDSLEERFSHLRRDVGRLEFNVAQAQAALDVVAHDRAADKGTIRDLRNEWSRAQIHLDQQRGRLVNLELMTTNLTLQRCRADSQVATRDSKLASMELWLSQADRRIDESARRSDMARRSDENLLRSLREALSGVARKADNATSDVKAVEKECGKVKRDLEKFVRQLPKDCSKVKEDRISLIQVPDIGPTEVVCDASTPGGPWLVLQRRFNGSEGFFRNWTEYRRGFGNLDAEFWLGNEIIHRLTSSGRPARLRVDMWDVVGRHLFAEYGKFAVRSEDELYALEVGRHSGNATDALRHHSGMGFSTLDRDNDASSTHCAVHYTGGWWYQHCHRADLNGRYALGMTWYDEFSRDWIQLEKVEMKMAVGERVT